MTNLLNKTTARQSVWVPAVYRTQLQAVYEDMTTPVGGKRTEYRLDGRHLKVACESCHSQPAPKGKDAASVGSNCIGCHRKDDTHDGQFGMRCETCHVTDDWKKVANRVSSTGSSQVEALVLDRLPPWGFSSRFARPTEQSAASTAQVKRS